MTREAVSPAHRPPSPCVRICTLDDANLCLGCGRTLDEIVRWSGMSAAEQWQIVGRMPAREPVQGEEKV